MGCNLGIHIYKSFPRTTKLEKLWALLSIPSFSLGPGTEMPLSQVPPEGDREQLGVLLTQGSDLREENPEGSFGFLFFLRTPGLGVEGRLGNGGRCRYSTLSQA